MMELNHIDKHIAPTIKRVILVNTHPSYSCFVFLNTVHFQAKVSRPSEPEELSFFCIFRSLHHVAPCENQNNFVFANM